MVKAKKPPVVLGSTAATRRQWLRLWSATTVLSGLNCLLFYFISRHPDAILPGCVAVVMGAGVQALVFADRAFAGIESRWALSSRRDSAVLFGARFRPNVRFLPLYARLGGSGGLQGGASRGARLAGNGEGKAGETVGMPARGGPALADQPPDKTDNSPPSKVEWPELKLDYKKIGLAIVVLLVPVGVYLWLRRKRQDEKTERE